MSSQSELLQEWILQNKLKAEILDEYVVNMTIGKFLLIRPKEFVDPIINKANERVLAEDMCLILSDEDIMLLNKHEIDYFLIRFGKRFYYFDEADLDTKTIFDRTGEIEATQYYLKNWREFRYIGKPESDMAFKMSYLGIHGSFELCNGSRSYKDWCIKAKWLGIESLGICENNTLAGSLDFQNTCEKFQIKSIIGETISVKSMVQEVPYQIKLYVINDVGWRNLLSINAYVNINNRAIPESILSSYSEGLIAVLTATIDIDRIYLFYTTHFKNRLYYQLDLTEWGNTSRDTRWLETTSKYVLEYRESIEPILVQDAFYLEKVDGPFQETLRKIGKQSHDGDSRDKWFKTVNELLEQAIILFPEGKGAEELLGRAIDNTLVLSNKVDFKISTGNKYLPAYELSKEEKEQYGDAETLFWALIEKGLQEKVVAKGLDVDKYLERIQEEVRVIELGQVRDYFLITWDIHNFCRENGIWTGLGRGSAAGCLISYLLNIVRIDPLKYDLLFERFLNEGRMGKPTEVEYLQIQTDEGSIEIDLEKTITILRERKEIVILAKELQDGDEILQYM